MSNVALCKCLCACVYMRVHACVFYDLGADGTVDNIKALKSDLGPNSRL